MSKTVNSGKAPARLLAAAGTAMLDPGRLVLLFALTVLSGIWGGLIYEIREDRIDALQDWTVNLGNLTRSYEEHTLRTLAAVDQDLKFVRNQYQRYGRDVDLSQLARQDALNEKLYIQIGVMDANGAYVASNRPFQPASMADREHFRTHLDNRDDKMYIGKPLIGRLHGRMAIQLTRRITGPDGSFQGVASASMDPDFLSALYNDVDLGAKSVISLAGLDGIIRARRSDGRLSVGEAVSTVLFKRFQEQQNGSQVAVARDGTLRLFSFRRLPDYPMVVIMAVSMDHVYERSDQRRDGYLAIGSVATSVIMLFSALILRLLRRQAQSVEVLRRSRAQAESANRLKSDFLASMSHELRTPLNGILGFSDILRHQGPDDKSRRYGNVIHTSGSHLLALLNSILDLAKVEAGKMDVFLKEEDLLPLITSTVQIHQITAAAKGLTLEIDADARLPETLTCDITLVRQVLNNLINNAIKFTDTGGVTVQVERGTGPNARYVRLAVKDTGIGIAPENCRTVFEKFTQEDQSVTRTHQGTGLGLALARQLVTLMGGEIGLTSTLGQGTTIHFTLPILSPPAPVSQPLRSHEAGSTVLSATL